MAYTELTQKILDLCKEGDQLLRSIDHDNTKIKKDSTKTDEIVQKLKTAVMTVWQCKCLKLFDENGLLIETEKFNNYISSATYELGYNMELGSLINYIKDRKNLLISIADAIERKKANIQLVPLTIDDIDNFKDVQKVKGEEVKKFINSNFLEDDVEETFLEALNEPYKEHHSGAETRDIFTNRLCVKSKRLKTVIMLKGRSVKGPLTIDKCGTKGNQLLKLAKNNSAECFIVQHVNKIEPDVIEALTDHVLSNSKCSKVYIGAIDGVDTARFLKSRGKNLTQLKNKRKGFV